jgi:hypothetical protein
MREQFEQEQEPDVESLLNRFREEAISKFVEACYEAYDLIIKEGVNEEEFSEREEIRKALRKMLALFESREEYEKCKDVAWILEREFPGFETTPDYAYIEEMGL